MRKRREKTISIRLTYAGRRVVVGVAMIIVGLAMLASSLFAKDPAQGLLVLVGLSLLCMGIFITAHFYTLGKKANQTTEKEES